MKKERNYKNISKILLAIMVLFVLFTVALLYGAELQLEYMATKMAEMSQLLDVCICPV